MGDTGFLKQSYSATSYVLYSAQESKLRSLISSLPQSNDDDLKTIVESRLSRGSVFCGNSQITSVDFGIEPANCYFCLINPYDSAADGEQFVVCFITECNRGLDSFKLQLDQHAHKIESAIKSAKSVELTETVKPLLERWYRESLLFIVNCIQVLGKDIKYIIYNAVANGQISVDTDDKQFEADLERFHASCTLSALLSSSVESSESSDTSGSLIDLDSEPKSKTKRVVDILCVTFINKQITFSHQTCTSFCEKWAQAMLEKFAYSAAEDGDINPLNLKSISETYKLKTIQDMNTLKRIVKDAELDFYALYRSHLFIRNSGNSPILLMHAMNEENNPESVSILKLLEQRAAISTQ